MVSGAFGGNERNTLVQYQDGQNGLGYSSQRLEYQEYRIVIL